MNSSFKFIICLLVFFVKIEYCLSNNLNNEKTDRVLFSLKTPIWFAEGTRDSNNVTYKQVDSRSLHDALKFFENPKNMAGIEIEKNIFGNWYFKQYIKNSTESKEIPEKLSELWLELFNKLHNNFTVSKNFKRSIKESHVKDVTRRVKYVLPVYDGPDPIYPRILLFVNFKENYATDRDLRFYKLLIYLIAFWNSVDLEFTEFEFPSIKFHIAGIVIGNNEWAAPWLKDETPFKLKFVYKEKALNKFREYLNLNDPLPGQWDIPISQSDTRFCSNDDCIIPNIRGMSLMKSTCNFNPKLKRAVTLVLFFDDYLFGSIVTAAHEIGHAFGADHDGHEKSLCDEHGFIMTSIKPRKLSPAESWSWCSKYEILLNLRYHSKICWNFEPSIDKINQVPEILPGHMVTPKGQCIERGYDDVCQKLISTCDILYCKHNSILDVDKYLSTFENCENANSPLSGSYCDYNSQCINKKCVPITI